MQDIQKLTIHNAQGAFAKYSVRQRLFSLSLSLAAMSAAAVPSTLAHAPQAVFASAPVPSAAGSHAGHGATTSNFAGGPVHIVHPLGGVNSNSFPWSLHQALPAGGSSAWHAASSKTVPLVHSLAAQSGQTAGSSNVDLTSPVAMFAAGSLAGFHSITLDVGGQQQKIEFGTKLTASELVAAQQVLSTGKQQLVVDASGVATGGTFNLSNSTLKSIDTALGGSIGALDISHGVVAIDTLSRLTLTGSLTNSGTIDLGAATGARGQTTDVISAANIYNQSGGVIASASGISGVKGANVSLSTAGALDNSGTISSGHDLNISAASTLTNGGLIASAHGNVNISNGGGAGDINVVGTGGTVQALNGNINFNSAGNTGSGNINVLGGNLISQQVNFNAGTGTINADLGEVSGVINGTAGCSHVTADTKNLQLGNITVSGDPTYFNTGGDVTINGTVAATSGNDLAIVASGNIIANGGALDTSSKASNGGALTLIAGANFTTLPVTLPGQVGPDASTVLTLTNSGGNNGSATGGYIDLSGITLTGNKANLPVTKINTAGNGGLDVGGNVLMVAYAGGATPGVNAGSVVATATSAQKTGASTISTVSPGVSGSVTIIAGGKTIQAQNIDVSTPGLTAGVIQLITITPTISGANVTILNGTVTGSYNTPSQTSTGQSITVHNMIGGTGSVFITTNGTLNESSGGVASGKDIRLFVGSAGTLKAPFVTNTVTSGQVTITGNSLNPIFLKDLNTTDFTLVGASNFPGQSITATAQAATFKIGNLDFSNINIQNSSATGNILINPLSAKSTQVGELYAFGSPALGNGVVTITAIGAISEGPSTDPTQAVVVGQNVSITSTGSDIANFGLPLGIVGATLTANAVKGNLYINDLVQTTLNAGSASTTGTSTYSVTGNGLALAGPINAAVIDLTAGTGTVTGGPGTVLDINATIGTSKTLVASLSGDNGIIQTNAKAFVTAQQVILGVATSGGIGSAAQPIMTKSFGTLQVKGYATANPTGADAFVVQTGKVNLVASGNTTFQTGSLQLNVSAGTLGVFGAITYGTTTLTASTVAVSGAGLINTSVLTVISPTVTVTTGGVITATTATFETPAALSISGLGTIGVTNSLTLGASAPGTTASVTLGMAKDGTQNPLAAAFNKGIANLTVSTKGNFTLDDTKGILLNDTALGGTLSITATNIVNSGAKLNNPGNNAIVLAANGAAAMTAGTINLNLTGSQAVTIDSFPAAKTPASYLLQATGMTDGAINVATKGTLAVNNNGLVVSSLNNESLTFNDKSLVFGATVGTITAKDIAIASPALTVNGTLTATNSTTLTNNGPVSVTGGGSINPGPTLNLGSIDLVSGPLKGNYVSTSVILGNLKVAGNDPLSAQLASGTSKLVDLSIATTGSFTTSGNSATLDPANSDAIGIVVGKIVQSQGFVVPYTISTGGAGALTLNITGAQPVSLSNVATPSAQIALLDSGASGGLVSVTTKGALTVNSGGIQLGTAAGFVHLTSQGLLTLQSGGLIDTNAGGNLSLSGSKGLVVNDKTLLNAGILGTLTLTSGATTPFNVAEQAGVIKNGTAGSIGDTANMKTLTINVGAGIVIDPSAKINAIASNGVAAFKSTSGLLSITGPEESIILGTNSTLDLNGKTGIALGTVISPLNAPNPLDILNDPILNPVTNLTINTPGTFKAAFQQIILMPFAGNGGNMIFKVGNVNLNFGPSPANTLLLEANTNGTAGNIAGSIAFTLTKTAAANFDNYLAPSSLTIPTFQLEAAGSKAGVPNAIFGSITASVNGSLTVIKSSGIAGVTASTLGATVSLTSGGNQTDGVGAIALAPTGSNYNLTLASGKNLSVLDTTLLKGNGATAGSLNSISLSSVGAASFVIDTTGLALANGTAGDILAPNVTITTPSLTNNGNIDGNGTGNFGTLQLGSPGKSAFTIVQTGTGNYGVSKAFDSLDIVSSGNINLGKLFTDPTTFGIGGSLVNTISITGPTVAKMITPAGNITFFPTVTELAPINVGAGSGGTIVISAKSLAFTPTTFLFDVSSGTTGRNVSITLAAPITFGTAKGDIQVNVGGGVTGGVMTITSTGGLLTFNDNPALPISILSGSLRGNSIVINTNIVAATEIDVLTNITSVTGTITTTPGHFIESDIDLFIGQGSSKMPATPIQLRTPDVELNRGALNIVNTNADPTAAGTTINKLGLLNIASVILNNTDLNATPTTTTVSGITATAGGISIIDHTTNGTLMVGANSTLSATGGSILLQSTEGSIDIGTGVTMHASGTAPGVGQIIIVTGGVPLASTLIAGAAPGTASTTPTMIQTVGGNVTYSVAGFTGGTITVNAGGNTLSALQRNIVFNEGTLVNTITLEGSDTITADPPVGAANPVTSTVGVAAGLPGAFISPATSFAPIAINNSINSLNTINTVNSTQTLFVPPTSISPAVTVATPATGVSGIPNRKLRGEISNAAWQRLGQGATFLAPIVDTIVQTDFGSVAVAAHSVALVMSFDGGVAVYNLHDSRRDAVVVNYGGHEFSVMPGRNAVVTNRDVRFFEEINPAQCVAYRRMTAKDHGDGVKSFQSEFNVVSLLQGFEPLKQFARGNDPQSRKVIVSMLKTAAILSELGGASAYERLIAPQRTAIISGITCH